MISQDQLVPMNEYFLQKLYQKPDAFKSIQSPKTKEQSLFGTNNALQFSPNNEYGQGNTGRLTRDAVKTASIINSLEYIHPDDAKSLVLELKDANVKRAFHENGNMPIMRSIIEKAASCTSQSNIDSLTSALPIDRQLTYTDEMGNTILKQANSNVSKV